MILYYYYTLVWSPILSVVVMMSHYYIRLLYYKIYIVCQNGKYTKYQMLFLGCLVLFVSINQSLGETDACFVSSVYVLFLKGTVPTVEGNSGAMVKLVL